MKQVEFKLLSKEQQQEALWQNGFVIGSRKDKKFAYSLYALEDFLVEIQYEDASIKNIECYRGTQHLSKYPSLSPVKKPGFRGI